MVSSRRLAGAALLCLLALLRGNVSAASDDALEAVVQIPHLEAVIAVAFSPDGNSFATGSNDRTAKLWDFASGQLLRTFTGHTGRVDHVAFTPDGRRLLTSDGEGQARLWDIHTGKLVRRFGNDKTQFHQTSLSADGRVLFGVGYYDKQARLFSVDSGELRVMPGGIGLRPYLLNADGSRLLAARRTKDGTRIELLDTRSGAEITHFPTQEGGYTGLALSPDGKRFAAASESDNTLRLWNLETGKHLSTVIFPKNLSALTFSGDGQRLAAVMGNERLAVVIDTSTGASIRTIREDASTSAVAFRADGNYLLVATGSGVTLWDVNSGHLEYHLSNRDGAMDRLTWATLSPDGLYATTESQVWDLATAKLAKPMRAGPAGSPAVVALITPDSRTTIGISTGGEGAIIRRWELTTGRERGEITIRQKGKLHAISADGRFVAMAEFSDRSMHVWDTVQGKSVHVLGVHPANVSAAAFSGDGRFVATGAWTDEENTVMVWDAGSGKKLHELKVGGGYMDEIAFSPTGALLAVPSMFTTTLFDAATGKRVAELPGQGTDGDSTLLFINDKTLAAGTFNGDIRLWNVATRSLLATLHGHSNYVRKLSVSADGRTLLSASHDGTAKLWDIPKRALVATLVPAGEDDYAILSPNNDYAASRGAARRVNFVKGVKAYSFDNFDLTKNRPDLIAEQLGRSSPETLQRYRAARTKRLQKLGFATQPQTGGLHLPECELRVLRPIPKTSKSSFVVRSVLPGTIAAREEFAVGDTIDAIDGHPLTSMRQALDLMKAQRRYSFAMERNGVKKIKNVMKDAPSFGFVFGNERDSERATSNPVLPIEVIGRDRRRSLSALRVLVNGVPMNGTHGLPLTGKESQGFKRKLNIDLSPGQNDIEVSVMNDQGAESLRERYRIEFTAERGQDLTYVVAIGVSEYQQADYNLTYAAKDARDVAAAFAAQKGPLTEVRVLTLLDQEVTRESLDKARAFLKPATVADKVVVFVAGHGLLDEKKDYYLATWDLDFAAPAQRGIRYESLQQLLDETPARRKILMMDACHSGEVDKEEVQVAALDNLAGGQVKSRGLKKVTARPGLEQSAFSVMRELFADLRRDSGAVVISSASGIEFAFESPQWNNGVFTYALLDGLRGAADTDKNKRVTVSELLGYVAKRVPALTNGQQTPTSRRENIGVDFLMGRLP